jgi:hypothetical protein
MKTSVASAGGSDPPVAAALSSLPTPGDGSAAALPPPGRFSSLDGS